MNDLTPRPARGRRFPFGRRLTLIIVFGVLFLAVAFVERETIRHSTAELLGVQFKNDLISIYSIATAPTIQTDDLVPIAHASQPPYAVNVFLDQEVKTSDIARSLDMIKAAGFYAIKQELEWDAVERPTKGQYLDSAVPGRSSWAKYDQIVQLANERGLQVIFRIDTSPSWARPGVSDYRSPPEWYQDYGDFVAAVVKRYKGKVHYYQIWNEPNLAFEWGNRPATPEEYTALLCEAYRKAKAVDPSAVILTAALAPTVENSDRATSDVPFLQGMYDAGARPCFDVLSVNAYGLRNGPDDWRFERTTDVNFSRPVVLRGIMVQNGDASKPIWASEIGWDSLPADWTGANLFGSVSRAIQAAYTVRAFERAEQQWPWMGNMAVWHFRMVQPSDLKLPQYYFDLVSIDWKPEPVYYALQKLMTAPPVVYRGYHQEDYYALHWGSGWSHQSDQRAVLGGYNLSTTPGATLTFDLDASWLDLVTPVGPRWGKLAITIDGSPYKANRLPRQGNAAILDLGAPGEAWGVRHPIADGLGPGVHHVVIRVLSGPVGIDGLVADRESPRDILYWQLTGGIIGVGFLIAGRRRCGSQLSSPFEMKKPPSTT